MQYEEIAPSLLQQVPEFHPDADELELPYSLAGSFAHFLLEMHQEGNVSVLERGLAFIECLCTDGERKVTELATIGYLEAIQNVWRNRGSDPEVLFASLGEESKKGGLN